MQNELYMQAYRNSMLSTDLRLEVDERESIIETPITDVNDVLRAMGNALANIANSPNGFSLSNEHKAFVTSQVYDILVRNGLFGRY